MTVVIILFLVGLALSAFFSGSETGFYRVTRVRLLIDALTGDWVARGLLWTTNHPSVFVATALVGNNLANYFSSLSVVMGAQVLFPDGGERVELIAPLLVAPVLFIYGELLPKNVFYDAPHRFLRRCGPGLFLAAILFAPITLILWAFNKFLQFVVRQSPQVVELVIARRELAQLLTEGHEVGILRPAQQTLAQATFSLGGRPVQDFVVPLGRYARATTAMSPDDVLRLARRQGRELIPVEEPSGKRKLVGYLRVADLAVAKSQELPPLQTLVTLTANETYLRSVLRLMEHDNSLGQVVSDSGKTLGFVTARMLTEALFTQET